MLARVRNAAAEPVWERYQAIVAQWAIDHADDAEWWQDFVADASVPRPVRATAP